MTGSTCPPSQPLLERWARRFAPLPTLRACSLDSEQFATNRCCERVAIGDCGWLLDVNRRPAKPPPMTALTQDTGKKTSVAAISIAASGSMALAKLVVGIAIGSLSLFSEALHSSIALVATNIPWTVVRVSDLPADDEHHYGHGTFASLSALGITALLYILAGGILVEAY